MRTIKAVLAVTKPRNDTEPNNPTYTSSIASEEARRFSMSVLCPIFASYWILLVSTLLPFEILGTQEIVEVESAEFNAFVKWPIRKTPIAHVLCPVN